MNAILVLWWWWWLSGEGWRYAARSYVLGIGLALIATVPLSELLAHWADMQPRWVLAPAAALIAARPDWL